MRHADVAFLDADDVQAAHDEALRIGGGSPGVLNAGMVASAAAAPANGHYNTLGELAAAYVHGIARNHGFVDGNKRTAAVVLGMFLGANGYPVVLADEWAAIIEHVADGSASKHELTDMIVARLLGGVDVQIEP